MAITTLTITDDYTRCIAISNKHFVYLQDIMGNFDYYYNGVEPEVIGQHTIVDYSNTKVHRLKTGELFEFTGFAEIEATNDIYLDKAKLKPGDIVLDFGAYCGLTSQRFAKIVGEAGLIYAFEPDPKNYAAMLNNIKRHNMTNVVPVNMGIWCETGRQQFQIEANMGTSISHLVGRNSEVESLPVICLDDFSAIANFPKVDFVKMDIEGAELQVLESAENFVTKYRPRFIIEPHYIKGQLLTDKICQIMTKYGYTCFLIEQAGLPMPLIYCEPK